MTRSVILRIIREPLFAFVVMGGVLYFAHSQLRSRHSEPVVLQAATRAALIGDFEKLHGRKATADDLARIEHDYLTDELLFREALENGLHRSDPSVRSKLVENMRYRITGPLADPTDEQLVNYYSENLDRYRAEPVVSFGQVYFAERPPDPAAVLAQLQQGGPVTGQPFRHGREFPRYGYSMLRGMFGQPMVESLSAAPLGEWIGPLESPYGWHYVRATERLPAALLPFDAVRQQVESDFMVVMIDAAVDRHLDELRRRHEVRSER